MRVTLKRTKEHYPEAIECEQVAAMQLFLVHYPDYSLLVSYRTVVGYAPDRGSCYAITDEQFSVTTTQQLSRFARMYEAVRVSATAWGKGRLYL